MVRIVLNIILNLILYLCDINEILHTLVPADDKTFCFLLDYVMFINLFYLLSSFDYAFMCEVIKDECDVLIIQFPVD